jgi:D-lactate dehydratase / protein deglycase
MLKKVLGLAPKLESDGSYSPSKMAVKMGVVDKTDFETITYQKYEGKKSKILVIFTENKNLKMKNGKFFSTGNHPVEALLPMLHLKNAGFDFEIATPTGRPVVFEMWAFPEKDTHVKPSIKRINQVLKTQLNFPTSLIPLSITRIPMPLFLSLADTE